MSEKMGPEIPFDQQPMGKIEPTSELKGAIPRGAEAANPGGSGSTLRPTQAEIARWKEEGRGTPPSEVQDRLAEYKAEELLKKKKGTGR